MKTSNNIYIDFTNGVVDDIGNIGNGGGVFALWLTKEILNLKEKNNSEITILVRKNTKKLQKNFDNFDRVSIIEVSSLFDFNFSEHALLIIPLISNYKLFKIRKLKRNNVGLSVNIVIHGVRNIDLVKFDKFDKYYSKNANFITDVAIFFRKKIKYILETLSIKHFLPYADRVYTVSNNSMQHLIRIAKLTNVKYFHQKSQVSEITIKESVSNIKYGLFVNINREEKNFIRTLVAFCEFKKNSKNDLFLYCTGSSEAFIKKLKKVKILDWGIIDKWVKFFEFLPADKFAHLYAESDFLVYTSKSEGYGIPVLEAALAGKKVIASNYSSIPEVLGPHALYVYPYSISSIITGFENVSVYINTNREELADFLLTRQKIDQLVINEIIN